MASVLTYPRSATDYTIACICPMGVELAPVRGMLDEIHDPLPLARNQNAYALGRIGRHDVVVAVMPETGNNAAAAVTTQLLNDFPAVRFGLLVGIGGAVPGTVDVRLGDVVVSQPSDTFGGVVQYDLGKRLTGGRFQRLGFLSKPPQILSAHVRMLEGRHLLEGHQLLKLLSDTFRRYPRMQDKYKYPSNARDDLFLAAYSHQAADASCENGCDLEQTVTRPPRSSSEPRIHYGTIGSANVVVKDATLRDELRRDMNVICVEMEAAGLLDTFPCLVIRGICDYADSHKNAQWQAYAAAMAAAYMKELLLTMPAAQVERPNHAVETVASQFQSGLHLYGAPTIERSWFVGRTSEINDMSQILRPGEPARDQRRLVLGGMGGIGKTQLAITYAKRYAESYSSLIWLNATTELTLKKSLWSLVDRIVEPSDYDGLDEKQMARRVQRWLSDARNTQWLLLIDNYDDPDSFDIEQYMPYTSHGSILITTRLPNRVVGHVMRLSLLNGIEDGLRILETRSGRESVVLDDGARRLTKHLGGLPLALAAAGAYLRHSAWTFEQYHHAYTVQSGLNPSQGIQLREYQDRTLHTAWDISYTQLKAHNTVAAKLLQLLAYFDNQRLWRGLFRSFESLYPLSLRPPDQWPSLQWIEEIILNDTDFDGAMRTLAEYCFIEVHSMAKSYSMHTCVHDWTLSRLNRNIDADSYYYALDCAGLSLQEIELTSRGHVRHSTMAAHAARLAHNVFKEVGRDDRHQIPILVNVAGFLMAQHQFHNAEQLLTQALAGYEKTLEPDHVQTLLPVHRLGTLYSEQGRPTKAEQMYKRALRVSEKAFGTNDGRTLATVSSLGRLYCNQGRPLQAKQMYLRALIGRQEAHGLDHELTLSTILDLGITNLHEGNIGEALQMLLRALVGQERVLGADHITTLTTLHFLGVVQYQRRELVEAERMFRRALAGRERALGPDHTSTILTVSWLGYTYHAQKNLQRAWSQYTRALTNLQEILARRTSPPPKLLGAYARLLGMSTILQCDDDNRDASDPVSYIVQLVQFFQQWSSTNPIVSQWLVRVLVNTRVHADDSNTDNDVQQVHLYAGWYLDNRPLGLSGTQCDGCYKRLDTDVGFFCCRSCAENDLCKACMDKYTNGELNLMACNGHEYFDVGAAILRARHQPEGQGRLSNEEWINALLKRYQGSSDVT